MKRTPFVTQRQEDGSYLVHASDGAWLHRLGVVRGEWLVGPKKGRARRWHLQPEAGLRVDMAPAHTLGEARGRLVRAWHESQRPGGKGHGLPGLFVVVEGGDGAGKSTLVAGLVAALSRRGLPVSSTEEPSRGPVGRLLREALAGRGLAEGPAMAPQEWALLYAADRAHHLREGVLPALAGGEVVVCSRYTLSSLAYQGPALGLEWVATVNADAPAPDVLLWLEVPPEVGLARAAAARKADAFENEARAQEAAAGYARALAYVEKRGQRVHRMDDTRPHGELLAEALEVVLALVEGRR